VAYSLSLTFNISSIKSLILSLSYLLPFTLK
jgi:hypothetical protein